MARLISGIGLNRTGVNTSAQVDYARAPLSKFNMFFSNIGQRIRKAAQEMLKRVATFFPSNKPDAK